MTFFFGLMLLLSCGFYLASKAEHYDSDDYMCPSRFFSHTNRQARDDKENK